MTLCMSEGAYNLQVVYQISNNFELIWNKCGPNTLTKNSKQWKNVNLISWNNCDYMVQGSFVIDIQTKKIW